MFDFPIDFSATCPNIFYVAAELQRLLGSADKFSSLQELSKPTFQEPITTLDLFPYNVMRA